MSEEQELLVASFTDLFRTHATPARVREAEVTGHDPGLWSALVDVGIVEMALPAVAGGWDASLLDLALVAELAGRAVAPAPIVDAQVAARLLARTGDDTASAALRSSVDAGVPIALALHEPVAGTARLVPAGAVARHVVGRTGDRLWLVDTDTATTTPVTNLGSQPLADVEIAGAVDLVVGPDAVRLHDSAIDEWSALTAAALVGVAARAHEMAVDYAKERIAFGSPIGAFQAISHPLADHATALDGARLLAREAAWTHGAAPDRFAELAAMAVGFASETARDVTYHAVHTHGGYGFMLEQDVQLHYRRARGWARVLGGPGRAYRRAADARYAEVS